MENNNNNYNDYNLSDEAQFLILQDFFKSPYFISLKHINNVTQIEYEEILKKKNKLFELSTKLFLKNTTFLIEHLRSK
jgi:hypothetical protein